MHSLETIVRLNDEAAERELARDYGRAAVQSTTELAALMPERDRAALAVRLRALRARLLAVLAALATSCGSSGSGEPPKCDPPFPAPVVRVAPKALAVNPDTGAVVGVVFAPVVD